MGANVTPERRLEIEQHANLYGSANGWAGTSGTLATMIRELMAYADEQRTLVVHYRGLYELAIRHEREAYLSQLARIELDTR